LSFFSDDNADNIGTRFALLSPFLIWNSSVSLHLFVTPLTDSKVQIECGHFGIEIDWANTVEIDVLECGGIWNDVVYAAIYVIVIILITAIF